MDTVRTAKNTTPTQRAMLVLWASTVLLVGLLTHYGRLLPHHHCTECYLPVLRISPATDLEFEGRGEQHAATDHVCMSCHLQSLLARAVLEGDSLRLPAYAFGESFVPGHQQRPASVKLAVTYRAPPALPTFHVA